jgi:Tfp pilus assembly protein PilN
MRAVNLIPADAKRGSRGPSASKGLPTYLFLGVLAIAVGLVTLYVLASNNISQRQAKVTTLQAEVAQVEAQSTSLNHYAQFSQMTQSRIGSVRQLATGRFDWHSTLTQIAQVVPKNTSLATLAGTAASADPTAAATATAASTGTPTGTSIQLTGCTKSQPDVAMLMSRLRLINGVASVTLNSSTKQESGPTSPSTPAAPSGSSAGSGGGGCGNGTPSFDMQISFATSSTPATPATPAASGAATATSTAAPTSAAPSATGGAS